MLRRPGGQPAAQGLAGGQDVRFGDDAGEFEWLLYGREFLAAFFAMAMDARGHFFIGGLRGCDEGAASFDGAGLFL